MQHSPFHRGFREERPAPGLDREDTPNDSPKWGNVYLTTAGLQNGPEASVRILNFNDEIRLPATHTLQLSWDTLGAEPFNFYDLHPVARIQTGTGAGANVFEVDWVHGTQLAIPITSVQVVLTFDAPIDSDSPVPRNIRVGAFLAPYGAPGAVRPVRSYRLPTLLAAGSTDVAVPRMARRVRAYAALPTSLSGAVQQLLVGPTVLGGEAASTPMDVWGPAQTWRLTAGGAGLTRPYAVFEVAA